MSRTRLHISLIAVACACFVSGCSDAGASSQRQDAQQGAKTVLDVEFAASDNAAAAACIARHATPSEVAQLAVVTPNQVTPKVTDTVLQIARREAVLSCILNAGISGLGA